MSNNLLIAINKEQDWTSSDVVIKARNVLSKYFNEKVKIGHMGTLDPMATGVLLLGVNKATRLFDYLLSKDKTYIGTLTFGTSTDTLDSTGNIVSTSSLPKKEDVEKAIKNFVGTITQIPPKYSAIKINGKKAYDLAREGKDFEIKGRQVNIYDIQILDLSLDKDKVKDVKLQVACSSGTYIRTLFFDIAKSINVDGHMSSLNRIKLANIGIEKAITIEDFVNAPKRGFINPIDVISSIMDVYELNDKEYYDVARGVGIKLENKAETLAFTKDGELKFIAKNIDGIYKSQANLE
ncbi:MAG: tRNA pseudouridine(55) synthase TruB [Clostridiales bacterium]|nr:tRNA pseudouridine(55) synthase TruB [Clostridiales bacterium]